MITHAATVKQVCAHRVATASAKLHAEAEWLWQEPTADRSDYLKAKANLAQAEADEALCVRALP